MTPSPFAPRAEEAVQLLRLPAGLRLLVLPDPSRRTVSLSVYVGVGAVHERRNEQGISHVVEHMLFKGTSTRSAARINLDAERLGAEANAHTDKDHTAFHMRGRPQDLGPLLRQLADLICHATFPIDELERERQVLLQEMDEVEDDPMASAYQLFDRACYGAHPAAQAVIGRRRCIEGFTRDALQAWVRRHFTGANIVVAATGPIDADALAGEAEAAFAGLAAGAVEHIDAPQWFGGVRTRRLAGSGQSHLVLGFPIGGLSAPGVAPEIAALLFGEGMSSPLMAELREREGLAYYAACAADRFGHGGQLAIEVSTAPRHLLDVLQRLCLLFREQAQRIDPVDLERARHQYAVRLLRIQEGATRKLEAAALELLATDHLRTPAELWEMAQRVNARTLRKGFQDMWDAGPALAMVGSLPRGVSARAREVLATYA